MYDRYVKHFSLLIDLSILIENQFITILNVVMTIFFVVGFKLFIF